MRKRRLELIVKSAKCVILGRVPRIHAKTAGCVLDCWSFGMDPRHRGEGDAL